MKSSKNVHSIWRHHFVFDIWVYDSDIRNQVYDLDWTFIVSCDVDSTYCNFNKIF